VAPPSFTEALPQLLYTLQAAPDRIDEIVLLCTQRFIDVHGKGRVTSPPQPPETRR
jgi:hypothetical protein